MRKILLFLLPLIVSACAGLKVKRADSIPPESKPGITFGGSVLSGGGVQRGYWCDVKGSFLTFGASGPTEAKATEIARGKCRAVYADSPCELISCKSN
jgi:hypothetical protein